MTEQLEPPDDMPEPVRNSWREIVAMYDLTGTVDLVALEAYATLHARMDEARQRVDEEGLVVTDPRGRVVPHPALEVERRTAEEIRRWADKFRPRPKAVRRDGYMVAATVKSIANAEHLKDADQYAGVIAATRTLAWLIDEAQREGMEALQKAAYGTIPQYLKACEALQITPASVPSTGGKPAEQKRSSKLTALRGGKAG